MNKDVLRYLYHDLGKSDSEIAKFLNFDRTAVVHMRKRLGIETRIKTGRIGELAVVQKLIEEFGAKAVIDMNEKDATSNFDILLFKKIRIEVKTSRYIESQSGFCFSFANPARSRVKASENVWVSDTGRTVKNLESSCDYVVLVFLHKDLKDFLIIPATHYLLKDKQTLRITENNIPKKYLNNFSLLELNDELKEG